MKIFGGIKKLELHHRIIAFLAIMILTIIVIRLGVLVVDPNPVFLNIQIHHFDYGLLLLLITSLLLLFGNSNLPIHLFMAGVAFGLIVDDLWFIRINVTDPKDNAVQIYNSTFLSVVILSIAVILSIFLINHFKKKRRNYS